MSQYLFVFFLLSDDDNDFGVNQVNVDQVNVDQGTYVC